jgi:hypothetical protein
LGVQPAIRAEAIVAELNLELPLNFYPTRVVSVLAANGVGPTLSIDTSAT